MQKKEFDLLFEAAKKLSAGVENAWLACCEPLSAECAATPDRLTFAEGTALPRRSVRRGDLWNGEKAWTSGWFKISGKITDSMRGKTIFARLNFDGEGLIFSETGKVRGAITKQSAFAHWYNREYHRIDDLIQPDGTFTFWVEAAANTLFGGTPIDGYAPVGHDERWHYDARVTQLCFGVANQELRQLGIDLKFLIEMVGKRRENPDPRTRQIVRKLFEARCAYAENPANAAAARAVLRPIFERRAAASALTTVAVGHAHIDTGWLWPVAESVRKAARTFANQLELIREYPDYVFGASAPQHFQFLKDHYPELYAEVKRAVAAGRIEPQGGMWVEADCNLTGGEAMVRQFVHGKNFFMDEFGFDVRNLWIPDVFGYSAAMPQILKKAGCDYFLTQKISWSQVNKFPHHTFLWRGIDGTEVLTHFPPEDTYNSECTPAGLMKAEEQFVENDFLDRFMTLFGVGDGGGGPKMELVENALRARDMDGVPKVQMGRACDFFDHIEQFRDQLAVWSGELYLELHRGTLTTQSRVKRGNRKCEQALRQVENLYAALPVAEFPAKELDKLWKKLLINQFHDILPGSSIELVYEQTEREHAEILAACAALADRASAKLLAADDSALTLVNVLSTPCARSVELPADWTGCAVTRDDGGELAVQHEADGSAVLLEIPAWSSVTLRRGARSAAKAAEAGNSLVLENALVRYEFDAAGRLVSARDLEAGRDILAGPGNVLSLYVDRPNNWQAWDVDFFYRDEKIGDVEAVSHRRIADGPARQGLEFTARAGEKSSLTQRIYLDAGSKRLEFRTDVDWHEQHKMLRVAFPTAVRANEASFDIQYGYVRRPTGCNTSWDWARFEVAAHRYADLSADGYGVALLNDCKYGHYVRENILDLNLLRSPTEPDPFADQGKHTFTYALLPHRGELIESNVMTEAAALNLPPLAAPGRAGTVHFPFAFTGIGVSLEVVKKAEKSDDRILRLVETDGRTSTASLRFPAPVAVSETNLIEWTREGKPVTGTEFSFELKPFEIKTVRVE